MAKFEEHCDDCMRLLGDRHPLVNRWIDELFKIHGPAHRRFRHCWDGVRQAEKLFGKEAAKAAIVHIIRDCGHVPKQRDYDQVKDSWNLGIISPEIFMYDGLSETARQKFEAAVHEAWTVWERQIQD